jgi:hypothetical protein
MDSLELGSKMFPFGNLWVEAGSNKGQCSRSGICRGIIYLTYRMFPISNLGRPARAEKAQMLPLGVLLRGAILRRNDAFRVSTVAVQGRITPAFPHAAAKSCDWRGSDRDGYGASEIAITRTAASIGRLPDSLKSWFSCQPLSGCATFDPVRTGAVEPVGIEPTGARREPRRPANLPAPSLQFGRLGDSSLVHWG